MADKLINLSLPPFAFLDDCDKELKGRNVILHTRSASVIEMLPREMCFFNEDTLTVNFDYINRWGAIEHFTAALHYCATLDATIDREMILKEIISPAVDWFIEYMQFEDKQIIDNGGLTNG